MRKLMFTVLGLLMVHSMQAQYFCTKQGTELHYVSYDEAGQSISNGTVTVTKAEENGNAAKATYYMKLVANKAKNNTSYTLYDWSYDGQNTVCKQDLMYGPYVEADLDPEKYDEKAHALFEEKLKFKGDNSFVIKDGAEGGESIPERSYSLISNMLKNEVTISGAAYMGKDSIGTTAGRFECIKISYLNRTKILVKSETERITEWYAKGVGLVKSESHDMKGKPNGKTLLVKIVRKD